MKGVCRGSTGLSPFRPASVSLLGFPLRKQDVCSVRGNPRFECCRERQACPVERVDPCGSCHPVESGSVGSKPEVDMELWHWHRGRPVAGGLAAPLAPQAERHAGASGLPRAGCQGRRCGAGGPRLPGTAHIKVSVGVYYFLPLNEESSVGIGGGAVTFPASRGPRAFSAARRLVLGCTRAQGRTPLRVGVSSLPLCPRRAGQIGAFRTFLLGGGASTLP